MSKLKYFQRCTNCRERAFQFLKNPEKGVSITADDLLYGDLTKPTSWPPRCQFCKSQQDPLYFGGGNLVARPPVSYPKYKGKTPVHWQWYGNNNPTYTRLVDASLRPFQGLQGTVLDIGSGDGLVDSLLVGMGLSVVGVEVEADGVAISRERVPGATFVCASVEDYAAAGGAAFDYLYSLDTIEHVEDPRAFVDLMARVRGFAVIVTDNAINRDGTRRTVKELHNREYSIEDLEALFGGFRSERLDVGDGSFIGLKIYPTETLA